MIKELLYDLRFTDKSEYPSWTSFPQKLWEIILKEYFFRHANSFGFIGVLESNDLKTEGLKYFEDWKLENLGLIEFNSLIICRFSLNEDCKKHLLENEFSTHWIDNKYYEFDELYFFKNERLIGAYIDHENLIQFQNLNSEELKTVEELDIEVRKHIFDRKELLNEIEGRKNP